MRTSPPPPATARQRPASNPVVDDESWLTLDQLAFLAKVVPEERESEVARLREWRDGVYFEKHLPPELAAREDEV